MRNVVARLSSNNMIALRWMLFHAMCLGSQPLVLIVHFFFEHMEIVHGNTRIQASWWHILNGSQVVKLQSSSLLTHIVSSWKFVLRKASWSPISDRAHKNSLPLEILATSMLISWEEKASLCPKFNRMARRLDLVSLSDAILPAQRTLMSFRTICHRYHVPQGYRSLWDILATSLHNRLPFLHLDAVLGKIGVFDLMYFWRRLLQIRSIICLLRITIGYRIKQIQFGAFVRLADGGNQRSCSAG